MKELSILVADDDKYGIDSTKILNYFRDWLKKEILILENTFLKVEVEQILEKERLGIKCY